MRTAAMNRNFGVVKGITTKGLDTGLGSDEKKRWARGQFSWNFKDGGTINNGEEFIYNIRGIDFLPRIICFYDNLSAGQKFATIRHFDDESYTATSSGILLITVSNRLVGGFDLLAKCTSSAAGFAKYFYWLAIE